MHFESWRFFYESDLQALYAPLVPVAVLFGYLLLSRRGSQAQARSAQGRFVRRYALVFSIATVLDVVATGPGVVLLDLGFGATSLLMLVFVLLSDFRVFLLVFALTERRSRLGRPIGEAALWSLIAPGVGWSVNATVSWFAPELYGRFMWLGHEVAFLALTGVLGARVIPNRTGTGNDLSRFLQLAVAYVATYYGLWVAADLMILFGGIDAGWLLRALSNQLYYGFWLPFVYFSFLRRMGSGGTPRLDPAPREDERRV